MNVSILAAPLRRFIRRHITQELVDNRQDSQGGAIGKDSIQGPHQPVRSGIRIRAGTMPRASVGHNVQPERSLLADIYAHVLDLAMVEQVFAALVDQKLSIFKQIALMSDE